MTARKTAPRYKFVQALRRLSLEHLERRLLLTVGPDGTPYLYLGEPYANIDHPNDLYLTEGQRDRLQAARAKLGQTGPGALQLISNYSEVPDELSPELAAIVEVVDQLVASGSLEPEGGSGQFSAAYSYSGHALISDRGEIQIAGRISNSADDPMPTEEQLRGLGIREPQYMAGSADAAAGGDDRFLGWVSWSQLVDLAHSGVVEHLQLPDYASSRGPVGMSPGNDGETSTTAQPGVVSFTEFAACGIYESQEAADAGSPSDLAGETSPTDDYSLAPPIEPPVAPSSFSASFVGPLAELVSSAVTASPEIVEDDQIAAQAPASTGGQQSAVDQAITDLFEPLSNDKFCEAFDATAQSRLADEL